MPGEQPFRDQRSDIRAGGSHNLPSEANWPWMDLRLGRGRLYHAILIGRRCEVGFMAVDDAAQVLAQECANAMWATDRACQAMGIKVESVAPGQATISMTVRPEMIGPGAVCGRGAIFLLADSALAFAANTRGHRVVA